MYHFEERSVSTATRYKKCVEIFIFSVNKSPIRYAFRNATESYTVQREHDFSFVVDIRPDSEYPADERNKLFSFSKKVTLKATILGIRMCSRELLL